MIATYLHTCVVSFGPAIAVFFFDLSWLFCFALLPDSPCDVTTAMLLA